MSLFQTPNAKRKRTSKFLTPNIITKTPLLSLQSRNNRNRNDEDSSTASNSNEENAKVVIRIKPIDEQSHRIWKVLPQFNIITQTPSSMKPCNLYDSLGNRSSTGGCSAYAFDKIFDESSETANIYKHSVRDIVESVVKEGKNGTVFCYGQTGSGKTFTMQGSSSSEGIVYLAAKDILRFVQNQENNDPTEKSENDSHCNLKKNDYSIQVSYLEIYNEEVRDLLQSTPFNENNHSKSLLTPSLQVREDPNRGVFVEGLKEVQVSSLEAIQNTLRLGERNRSVASTLMNERSSRSHAIFRITVQSRPRKQEIEMKGTIITTDEHDKENVCLGTNNISYPGSNRSVFKNKRVSNRSQSLGTSDWVTVSTLNLVDLAGSERSTLTGARGVRQKEGAKLNQSLLTLSRVIMGIVQDGNSHINFRDSKLTRILQPSLMGNARMAVICCISPSELYREETRSTLQFASRAKLIKTRAEINEELQFTQDSGSQHQQLQELISLKQEQHRNKKRFCREKEDMEKEMRFIKKKYENLTKFVLRPYDLELPDERKQCSDSGIIQNSFFRKGIKRSNSFHYVERGENDKKIDFSMKPLYSHLSPEDLKKRFSNTSKLSKENDHLIPNENSFLFQALQVKRRESQSLHQELDCVKKSDDFELLISDSIKTKGNNTNDVEDCDIKNKSHDKVMNKNGIDLKSQSEHNKKTIEDLLGQKAEALDWVEELLRENEGLQEKIEYLEQKQPALEKDQEFWGSFASNDTSLLNTPSTKISKDQESFIDIFNSQKKVLFGSADEMVFDTSTPIISTQVKSPFHSCSAVKKIGDVVHRFSEEHDQAMHTMNIQTKLDDLNGILGKANTYLSRLKQEKSNESLACYDSFFEDGGQKSIPLGERYGSLEQKLQFALNVSEKLCSALSSVSVFQDQTEAEKDLKFQQMSEEKRFLTEALNQNDTEMKKIQSTTQNEINELKMTLIKYEKKVEIDNAEKEKNMIKYHEVLAEKKKVETENKDLNQVLVELSSKCNEIAASHFSHKVEFTGEFSKSHDVNKEETKIGALSEKIRNKLEVILSQTREQGNCNKLFKQEMNELKLENSQLKVEKDRACSQIGELLCAAESRQKELDILTSRNEDIKGKIMHIESEKNNQNVDILDLKCALEKATEKNTSARNEINDLRKKLSSAETVNDQLKEKVAAAKNTENQYLLAENERKHLNEETKNLHDENERLQTRIREISTSTNSLVKSVCNCLKSEHSGNIESTIGDCKEPLYGNHNDAETDLKFLSHKMLLLIDRVDEKEKKLYEQSVINKNLLNERDTLKLRTKEALIKLESMEQELMQSSDQNKELITNISKLNKENENAKVALSNVEAVVTSKMKNISLQCDKKIRILLEKLDAQTEFLSKYRAVSKSSAVEQKQDKEKINEMEKDYSNLSSVNECLKEKLVETEDKLVHLLAEKSESQMIVKKLEKEIEEILKPKIESLTNNYNMGVDTISKLENSLKQNQANASNEINCLKIQRDEALATIERKLREEDIIEKKKMNETVRELQSRVEVLQREKLKREKSIEVYLEKHDCEQDKMDANISDLIETNKNMKMLMQKKEKEHKNTIVERDALIADLRALHAKKVELLIKESDDLRERIPKLESDVKAWKLSFEQIEKEIDDFEVCIRILQIEKTKLTTRCEELTQELRGKKSQEGSNEEKIAVLTAQLDRHVKLEELSKKQSEKAAPPKDDFNESIDKKNDVKSSVASDGNVKKILFVGDADCDVCSMKSEEKEKKLDKIKTGKNRKSIFRFSLRKRTGRATY